MMRLGILNMIIGFVVLFMAAAGGVFVAFDLTQGFLNDPQSLSSWQTTLVQSSHGHTNLFGLLHISLGLTLPYSSFGNRIKLAQTVGLALGTFAMGPLMLVRASLGPAESLNQLGMVIGFCLSMALVSLMSHALGLGMKYASRA